MNLSDLGEAFKTARIRSELTQAEAARAAGVGISLVSQLERGTLPEVGVIKLLALFQVVGLELLVRPVGQGRTLDDIAMELDAMAELQTEAAPRHRVRHPREKERV